MRTLIIAATVIVCVTTPAAVVSLRDDPDAPAPVSTISYEEWLSPQLASMPGANVRRRATQVYESFSGTLEQRLELALLSAYRTNGPMDDCLEKAGFSDWDWSQGVAADQDDPLGTHTWLSSPAVHWRSADMLAFRPFLLAERDWNDGNPPDLAAAILTCNETVGPVSDDDSYDTRPSGRLQQTWWRVVSDYQPAGMPGWRQLRACLGDSDIAILEPYGDQPLDEVLEDVGTVMNLVAPDDHDIPADPTDPVQWANAGWQEFLALEDDYAKAEWTCREDVYERFIDGLLPVIEGFAQEHAAEIAEVQAKWAEISHEAERLGFGGSGPRGP